ncbi:DUF695 domain-containing protein [Flectobacillus longus]|uniref:DUF695 domain-containing protein n=1 Tax=Flectobacillus longus TaxID=2984207 RepID=UPI0024B76457|nr:DUF695 domain-containing protein [Flectobacillus longus]MDI9879132.1 DUF695 domain-containing protein [Flectobacillus longus]
MSIIKRFFQKKSAPNNPYQEFWNWFSENEKKFFEIVKDGEKIDEAFFAILSPRLEQLHKGIFFLSGMYDEDIAELILTADGIVKNIVFIEELIEAAPALPNWKITALKQAVDMEDWQIGIEDLIINSPSLSFFPDEYPQYPDEIAITIVYQDYSTEEHGTIVSGIYMFLDNLLGELNAGVQLDQIKIQGPDTSHPDLIPISKLPAYLNWREKEFIEKYESTEIPDDDIPLTTLQATGENEMPLIATINMPLLNWDAKPSFPWVLRLELQYNGQQNDGLPNESDFEILNELEDTLLDNLLDSGLCLYTGRQVGSNVCEFYFTCKNFREPSKKVYELTPEIEQNFKFEYFIYRDKYWRSFEHFRVAF